MPYSAFYEIFFLKEKGKYTVTLIKRSFLISLCTQQEVVLLVMPTVFATGF